MGNDTLCHRSGPLRNRPQNGVQSADLLKESPGKDKGGQRGPSEGEAILAPAKRGGEEGSCRGAVLAPPRHRHGWEQPRERWIFVQTRGLQGTAGELPLAAPLAGLSHPVRDQPKNEQSHGEGIKVVSQREAARASGSLRRSAAPGERKEVASGIPGQSTLLLSIARHRGRVSLGSGPRSAAQGLSVRSDLTSQCLSVPACTTVTTALFSWHHRQM